jgi:hypothetical protein
MIIKEFSSYKKGQDIYFNFYQLKYGFAMGLGKLYLYFFDIEGYKPNVGNLDQIRSLTFSGFYDKLDGTFEQVFYKVLNPKFIKYYIENQRIVYEFKFNDSIELTKDEYDKKLKNK